MKEGLPPKDNKKDSYENLYLEKNLSTTNETESTYVDDLLSKLESGIQQNPSFNLDKLILDLKEMDIRVLMRKLDDRHLINEKNSNNFLEIVSSVSERLCISYRNLSKIENDSSRNLDSHIKIMNSYLKELISQISINQIDISNTYPVRNKMMDSYLMLFEDYPEDANNLFEGFKDVLTIGNKNDVFEKILNFKKNQDILVSSLSNEFFIQKIHNLGPNGTLELLDILDNYQEKNNEYSSSMVFFMNNIYTSIFNKKNDWEEDFEETTAIKNEDIRAIKSFENKLEYSYFLNHLTRSVRNEMERSMANNSESEIFGGNQIEPFEIQPGVEVILFGDQILQKTNKINDNGLITDHTRKYDPEYLYTEFKDRVVNLKKSIDNNTELERYKGVKMHRFGNIAHGGDFIEIDPRDTEKLELEYQAKLFFDKQIEFEKILGNLTKEQIREYILFLSPIIRKKIEDELNIKIKDFSYKKQLYILDMLKDTSVEGFSRVKDFSQMYGYSGLNTFLSIEQDEEMGDKILVLGEKLPKESADILFKTYGEMIDAADEVSDLLKTNLKEKATPELIEQTKRSLFVAGKDLLERYADKAETCEGDACTQIGKELEERLALAQKSVFAFSYACKVLVEKGEFSFEDFEKAKLSYDQSPLPMEMAEKIIKMHHENTKQYPESLRDLWRGTLKDGLNNPNPDQLIVSASYEDEVVSAMRVIKRADGSWYGASFNVNPTVQGSKIGTELLKEVLKGLAKDKPFVADCYSKNPMLKTYLNKFGFKITKEVEDYHDTGELVYEITIFPEDKKEI